MLVEKLYVQVREAIASGTEVDPYVIEVLAQLDRVTNFAHTGNPAVLTHGLMKRTWLSLGLLETGYPSLWPGVERTAGEFIGINPVAWPCDDDGRPRMASLRAQTLVYGPKHAEVSILATWDVPLRSSNTWRLRISYAASTVTMVPILIHSSSGAAVFRTVHRYYYL